jgi:hypothetical protein
MARPPTPAHKQHSKSVHVLVTPSQQKALTAKAARANCSRSEFLRRSAGLTGPVAP